MLTPAEVQQLASTGETIDVEFKQALPTDSSLAETICAFANDFSGRGRPAYVLLGVADNGEIVGIESNDLALQRLAQLRNDGSITPTPSLSIDPVWIDGKSVIVIQVRPSTSPPVRRNGVAYRRVGTTTTRATPDDERQMVERRRALALPFDARGLAGAGIEELDTVRFRLDYLPEAISPAVLAENQRTVELQLSALKLTDGDGRVTPTGLLVAGVEPRRWLSGAYIQFRRVIGIHTTDDTSDATVIGGLLDDMARRIEEKLAAHNFQSLRIGAVRHQATSLYPEIALTQILRNALMHRDYEMSAPIRVTWFDDRIQIDNPGGPYEISPEHFGRPGFTAYRNPNIAEAMHNFGLVEKFGFGLPAATKALEKAGHPPLELKSEGNFTFAVLRAKP